MRTRDDLRLLQNLPLHIKIAKTKLRIREWVNHYGIDGVYLAWSGGKDSTVLRHIIMQDYPEVESVFVNTGLEYPEIQRFVRAAKDRGEPVTILRTEMSFVEVIKKYGYPVISKEVCNTISGAKNSIRKGVYSHRLCKLGVQKDEYGGLRDAGIYDYERTLEKSMYRQDKWRPLLDADFNVSSFCCDVMKKKPTKQYEKGTGKKAFIGTMAWESQNRETAWMLHGCNAFESKRPSSKPMSFWTEQDVLEYIKTYNVEIPSVYGDVVYAEEPQQVRWEEVTDQPIGCDKLCTTGCSRTGCVFCLFGAHLERGEGRLERLKRTHPRQYEYCIGGGEYGEDGIWRPNKQGLGMGHVIDELNRLYGDGFIKY